MGYPLNNLGIYSENLSNIFWEYYFMEMPDKQLEMEQQGYSRSYVALNIFSVEIPNLA